MVQALPKRLTPEQKSPFSERFLARGGSREDLLDKATGTQKENLSVGISSSLNPKKKESKSAQQRTTTYFYWALASRCIFLISSWRYMLSKPLQQAQVLHGGWRR